MQATLCGRSYWQTIELVLGEAHYEHGDREKARQQYVQAIALLESVAQRHPTNLIWFRKHEEARQRKQELALNP